MNFHKTALHIAVEKNYSYIVKLLLECENIDINIKSILKNWVFFSFHFNWIFWIKLKKFLWLSQLKTKIVLMELKISNISHAITNLILVITFHINLSNDVFSSVILWMKLKLFFYFK